MLQLNRIKNYFFSSNKNPEEAIPYIPVSTGSLARQSTHQYKEERQRQRQRFSTSLSNDTSILSPSMEESTAHRIALSIVDPGEKGLNQNQEQNHNAPYESRVMLDGDYVRNKPLAFPTYSYPDNAVNMRRQGDGIYKAQNISPKLDAGLAIPIRSSSLNTELHSKPTHLSITALRDQRDEPSDSVNGVSRHGPMSLSPATQEIFDFFIKPNVSQGINHPRRLANILRYPTGVKQYGVLINSDKKTLETDHQYIQRLFPTDRPSAHANPEAPFLDETGFQALGADPIFIKRLNIGFDLILNFYGVRWDSGLRRVIELKPIPVCSQREWIGNPTNHNNMRITRIIRSMKLFGAIDKAHALFEYAISVVPQREKYYPSLSHRVAEWGRARYDNQVGESDIIRCKRFPAFLGNTGQRQMHDVPSDQSVKTPSINPNRLSTLQNIPDAHGQFSFHSVSESNGHFSNFFIGQPIDIDGIRWKTAEHYFQAQKFIESNEDTDAVKRVKKMARTAMQMANQPNDTKELYKYYRAHLEHMSKHFKSNWWPWWEKERIAVMYKVIFEKFKAEPLKNALLATKDGVLIEAMPEGRKDQFWGVINGVGTNMLGQILMHVRDDLRTNRDNATLESEITLYEDSESIEKKYQWHIYPKNAASREHVVHIKRNRFVTETIAL